MEFYLMPMFNKLCVQDIAKSEKWYSKTLGFKVSSSLEMISNKCL